MDGLTTPEYFLKSTQIHTDNQRVMNFFTLTLWVNEEFFVNLALTISVHPRSSVVHFPL